MPTIAKFNSLPDMKKRVKESGNHFFDKGAMEFFNSKIETPLISGSFFVTSEYMEDPAEIRYTARYFTFTADDGKYEHHDVGGFNVHESVALAKAAIYEFQTNRNAQQRLKALLGEFGLRLGEDPVGDGAAFHRADGEYLLGEVFDDGKGVELIEGNRVTRIPMADFDTTLRFAEYVRRQVDAMIERQG